MDILNKVAKSAPQTKLSSSDAEIALTESKFDVSNTPKIAEFRSGGEAIANGNCLSNTGFRTLSFESDLSLSPVLYARYSGYASDRGTFQRKGELVLTFAWGHGDPGTLYMNDEPMLASDRGRALWNAIKVRHGWVDGFLDSHGRGPSFIPEEVVKPEEYVATKAKTKRLEEFFSQHGLPLKPEDFLTSAKDDLKLSSRPIDFDPANYQASSKYHTGALVSIDRSERWFSSDGKGNSVELHPKRHEESGTNYAPDSGKIFTTKGEPGLPGWDSHRYLIRIVDGAHTRTHGGAHTSYGKTIDVWDVTAKG